jgi:uncharacterized protein (TIGR00296 family)
MQFELNVEEGKFLIQLARNTVMQFLKSGKTLAPPKETPKKLFDYCGVFVTINRLKNGVKELRGCIGYPYPSRPLVEAVIDSSINAATEDPRFESLSPHELGEVVFEVSVLSPPELVDVKYPMDYLTQIKIGEDGLIVERRQYKGLLLPQVPVEWGWCEEEFICQCCIKAGLPPDSWLIKDTKIYKFRAIIFEEKTPSGEIERLKLKK